MIRFVVSSIRSSLRGRPDSGRAYPRVAPKHAVLKNTIPFARDYFRFMVDSQRQYGDFYDANLPQVALFVISKPEYAKHVLVTNNKKYRKSFAYEFLRHPLGNGLLTSEGDFWLKQRRIAQPAFHRERLSALETTITEATQELIQSWKPYADRAEDCPATADLMQLTCRIVARALFGSDIADTSATIVRCINVINQRITEKVANPFRLPSWLPNQADQEYQQALQQLDKIVYDIIALRRRTGAQYHDLLAMLMETEDADTGECMSDRQVRDEVVTLFIAGTETSAVALSWALYLLARHPSEQTQAQLSPDCVQQVIQEAMRLYPPAWIIGREAQVDDEIDGYFVPRGAQVYICPYIIHRHPELWEEPERFWPGRFGTEQPSERHKFAYFPFGGGPRYCIGNHFATMEMQVILTAIIKKFNIKLADDREISPEPLITLRPQGGVVLRLTERVLAPPSK